MESLRRVTLNGRDILLLGTAHISQHSVADVEQAVEEESPDHVCIEIDESRYKSISEGQNWERLNIYQVLRQKKGFLLIANLVLSSFQRRMGLDLGVTPGAEMIRAIEISKEKNIPFSFCDREIQTTLRRAWRKTGFWGKNKMLAALLSSVFTKEKLTEEEIERLKNRNALEDMMSELADYLPSVKEVLIDERDMFLASKIRQAEGKKILAVVGAGHLNGIAAHLEKLEAGDMKDDISQIDQVPDKTVVSKILPWIIPIAVAAIIVTGFVRSGWQEGLEMLWLWILVNGSLSAVGSILALAHPITIIVSFLAAPITSMNPTIGVGFVTGILEAVVRKPRVRDFNNLQDDISSFRGFYRNRLTHILMVFFLSSVGSAIGTFIGIPWLTSLLAA
jgi:pheromone shutdown-related protein TraB